MAPDSKALLCFTQALPIVRRVGYCQAMLNEPPTADTHLVRAWLQRALAEGENRGLSPQGLADFCNVSAQAVYGWRKTGRITKSNLQRASLYFGHGPQFSAQSGITVQLREPQPQYGDWPFKSILRDEINRLTAAQLRRLELTMRQRLDEWAEDLAEKTQKLRVK